MNKPRLNKFTTEHGQELWMCRVGDKWYVSETEQGAYNASFGKTHQSMQKQLNKVHTALKHVHGSMAHTSVRLYETQKQLDDIKTFVKILLALFILCVPILFALVLNNV